MTFPIQACSELIPCLWGRDLTAFNVSGVSCYVICIDLNMTSSTTSIQVSHSVYYAIHYMRLSALLATLTQWIVLRCIGEFNVKGDLSVFIPTPGCLVNLLSAPRGLLNKVRDPIRVPLSQKVVILLNLERGASSTSSFIVVLQRTALVSPC